MGDLGIWFAGVRGKLVLLITMSTIVLGAVSGFSIYAFNKQKNDLNLIAKNRLPKAVLLEHLRVNNHAVIRYLLQAFEEKKDLDARTKFLGTAEERTDQFSDDLDALKKYENTEKFTKSLESIADRWKTLMPLYVQTRELIAKNTTESDQAAWNLFKEQVVKDASALSDAMNDAAAVTTQATHEYVENATNDGAKYSLFIILTSLAGALAFIAFGLVLAARLARGLTQITEALDKGSHDVASAATQIAASSEQLSSCVTEQAAALQETAASVEELSAMVTKNTENCAKARETSDQSHQSATQGKQVVGQMIEAIQQIHQSNTEMMKEIESSNQEITDIIKVIAEIGNKTKVINDIVFQTKLLSFNASVEAARAGEHGKGFAVVAEEVGNLAAMSGNAAREITSMLDESISKVENIVNGTKSKVERLVAHGKEKVENGSAVARQCGEVLDKIVQNVSMLNQTVAEISTASQEQDHGIKEITKAIGQLDQVTQQNSASSQETAGAADQLSEQSSTLRSTMVSLQSTVQGTHVAKQPATRPTLVKTPPAAAYPATKKASGKVVPIQQKSRKAPAQLAATGTLGTIPAENDDRFEDV
jgi:methyl-accepting chemotaxis protein